MRSITSILFLLFSILSLSSAACPDIHSPVVYPGSTTSAFIVAPAKTSSGKNVVKKDVFQNPVFQDRTYNVITNTFPAALLQAAYLSLYNDDKSLTTTNYVTLNFTAPMTLWLAFDSRATSLPQWAIDLGLYDSGLIVQRQDVAGSTNTILNMRVYNSLEPRSSVTLGGPKAPGSDSMYIPYFLLAPFTCSAETFSDNFFYSSTASNDFIPYTGLYYPWQYAGNVDWRVDGFSNRIRSLQIPGYRLILTNQVYASDSFSIQTKATAWGSTGTVATTLVFGLVDEIDPFYPELRNYYQLVWNYTTAKLSLTYTDYSLQTSVVASANFAQAQTSTNTIKITKEATSVLVYIDNLSTPALTATVSAYPSNVGRFGWTQKASNNIPYETFVDYLIFSGKKCF